MDECVGTGIAMWVHVCMVECMNACVCARLCGCARWCVCVREGEFITFLSPTRLRQERHVHHPGGAGKREENGVQVSVRGMGCR